MKRRKFISAVPAAILLGQRSPPAAGQTRKEGAMPANRIGPHPSEPANAGGADKRIFSDTLWDDAMSLYLPAKAC